MKRIIMVLLMVIFVFYSCIEPENPYEILAPGSWRAILRFDPNSVTPNPKGQPLPEKMNLEFEEVSRGELPFGLEVVESNDSIRVAIHNGSEKIWVDKTTFGVDNETLKGTFRFDFFVYNTYIEGFFEADVMEGKWYDLNRKKGYSIPFVAHFGENYRFTELKKAPQIDISGRWKVNFEVDGEPYPGIGEFVQNDNHVTGTFLTETGDYRYLEGTIQGQKNSEFDKLYLSVFDGAHAFLFEAQVRPDSTMIGIFRSGTHYRSVWEASKDDTAQLGDPLKLTQLNNENATLRFSLKDIDGKVVHSTDEKFKNKSLVVQLLGTWCPNCRDETKMIVSYLNAHPGLDVEFVGIGFEKSKEEDKALQRLATYKEYMQIQYSLLYGGKASKKVATELVGMIDEVRSFPTLLFLNRRHEVLYVHTGFNGPATSEFSHEKETFERLLKKIQK